MRDPVNEAIKQDIMAALKAFEKDDFGFVTTMGNRVTSNSLIGDRNELMVLGYLLREVGLEFSAIHSRDEKRIPRCKTYGQKIIQSLLSMSDKKINPKELWESYYTYENSIRKYVPTDFELAVYKDNPDFTRKATLKLIDHMRKNKTVLLDENNQLLRGVLNELTRIINVHGLGKADAVFYILIQALRGYYEYLLYSEVKEGKIDDKKALQGKIYPYIDRIINLFSGKNIDNLDHIYKNSIDILAELGVEWRNYFINYMEIIRTVPEERKIEIPKKAKEKIGETISRALEKEVKKGK